MKWEMGDSTKRMGVSGVAEVVESVDTFALVDKGGRILLRDVMTNAASKLNDFICAECANCEHLDVKSEQFEDHLKMQTRVHMRAGCKRASERRYSDCPDGFDFRERGWKAGMETEDITGYGDSMMRRVVTGYKYSIESPDPVTMNHLTLSQRRQQMGELMAEVHSGRGPGGTISQKESGTTIDLASQGRQVTYHRNGRVTSEGMMPAAMFEPAGSINWPKDMNTRPRLSDFTEEYMTGAPPRPKDLPSAPDAGTW